MSDTIDVSSDSSEGEGPTPAKRSRKDSEDTLSFKDKVQTILTNLTDAARGEFAVSGKIFAPIIAIALKVILLF